MPITDGDIDLPRSPSELRRFVDAVAADVTDSDAEQARGLMKQGVYKRFLDEIVPLSIFASEEYSDDLLIQPVAGNQGFDALVLDQEGREVDRIELTIPHDGMAAAADARKIVERGYGEAHVYGPGEEIDLLRPWALETALKKAQIDYSGATLVLVLDVLPLLDGMGADREQRLQELIDELAVIPFHAKRVRLLVMPDRVVPLLG